MNAIEKVERLNICNIAFYLTGHDPCEGIYLDLTHLPLVPLKWVNELGEHRSDDNLSPIWRQAVI